MLSTHQSPAPPQATPTEAERMVSTGRAVLVDVREQEEYAAGRSPSALWVPLGVLDAGGDLPPDAAGRTVLAICRSGNRSQHAVALLTARGVTAVNVAGGMRAWADAGLPVVTAHGTGGQVI
ncbi:rhodanese-like domain-containing protein [Kitasatospora sp. NPDC127059]|uniref:rhodanese-like domain-containing protein n=1 Tax=unclassified Kitasatospora TaxID=2633591 RepID=UPI00364CC3CC